MICSLQDSRAKNVGVLFFSIFVFLHTRRVFIVRSSESDNGATIKKYFASIHSRASFVADFIHSFVSIVYARGLPTFMLCTHRE